MNIEINVSRLEKEAYYSDKKVYKHLFATAERSITNFKELERVLPEIRSKFPTPEYKISINIDPGIHHQISFDEKDTDEEVVKFAIKSVYPNE